MKNKIVSQPLACIFLLSLSLSVLLLLPASLQAQQTQQTLLRSGISFDRIGATAAPSIVLTSIDNSTAALFHLRVGITYRDTFSFGGYFDVSLNDIQPESETLPDIYLDYWSVGAFAEYTLYANRIVHFTFPLYIGYGELEMDNEKGSAGLGEAHFFKIEPSALVEINLHQNVRLNLGAGYRFTGAVAYRNFDRSAVSGFTAQAGIRVGLFR